jgi:hypothetical protein
MAKMHPMVDMALDDEDILDMPLPYPVAQKPEYPWGLRIVLTDAEFQKLDLDPSEAFVGGIIHLHALARITSVSSNDSGDGASSRVEMQIQSLCVESEDAENDDD